MDSVKVIVDDSGQALTRYEYLPYGGTWFEEGEDNHNPKYNSQELDKETGYYFYNARYYDPEIARFVTADNVIDGDLDTQGWNRFSYVKGNPIVYKDPTGHEIKTAEQIREKLKAKRRAKYNNLQKRIDASSNRRVKLKGKEAIEVQLQLSKGKTDLFRNKCKQNRQATYNFILKKNIELRLKAVDITVTVASIGIEASVDAMYANISRSVRPTSAVKNIVKNPTVEKQTVKNRKINRHLWKKALENYKPPKYKNQYPRKGSEISIEAVEVNGRIERGELFDEFGELIPTDHSKKAFPIDVKGTKKFVVE